MMMNLVKQIASERGQSLEDVATETGVTRGQLYRVCHGRSGGSPRFWREMIRWSGGRVTPNHFYSETIKAVAEGADDDVSLAS